jgi:hypothetical protein
MDFTYAMHHARMNRRDVIDYFQISGSTFKRYKETNKAPIAIIECLLMIGSYCPSFSLRNDFTGWSFGSGFLYSPEGDKFTSGDVRAGKNALQEINRLHRIEIRGRKKSPVKVSARIYQFPLMRRESVRLYR